MSTLKDLLVIQASRPSEKPVIIIQPPKLNKKEWYDLAYKIQQKVIAEIKKRGNYSVRNLVSSLNYARKQGCTVISWKKVTYYLNTSDVIE